VHVPVLLEEMLRALRPVPGGLYLDGTLGAGGYAEAILGASGSDGRVVALDLDPEAVHSAAVRLQGFGSRFIAIHGGFHEAAEILASLGIDSVEGAVLDLGLSSDQLDDPQRGFSFRFDGPLDMRFDTTAPETALSYLQRISASTLEEILATYGDERYCKKLARRLIQARDSGRLTTAADLVRLVNGVLGRRKGRIHPATRTFQALRIAVNREVENLAAALEDIPRLLKPGGRFCVVSYHSVEDRLVKRSFRERSKEPHRWTILTPKPVRPSQEEVKRNSRARSAKMRVLEAGPLSECGLERLECEERE